MQDVHCAGVLLQPDLGVVSLPLPAHTPISCVACRRLTNLVLLWRCARLVKHNFPPGPIHLTRTHMPTLPVYISVGNFKARHRNPLPSLMYCLS